MVCLGDEFKAVRLPVLQVICLTIRRDKFLGSEKSRKIGQFSLSERNCMPYNKWGQGEIKLSKNNLTPTPFNSDPI